MTQTDKPKREIWKDGGYVRHGLRGPTYVIEKWVDGVHFHISTKKRTERLAYRELERFMEDPVAYRAKREGRAQRLIIRAELVTEYRDWMLNVKKTCRSWAFDCARYLADWSEDLGGIDMRHVSIAQDVEPALDKRKTNRKHRVEALKSFYGWCRKRKGLFKFAEDPTLDLPVPKDEQGRGRDVSEEVINKVLPLLHEHVRDVMLVQMATGAHISEVRRFAKAGELLLDYMGWPAVIMTTHKTAGHVPLPPLQFPEHIEAAKRIKLRKRIPARHDLQIAMKAACTAAGVPQFRLGQMRHSYATNAGQQGAALKEISEALHHASSATTQRYRNRTVPPQPLPPLRVLPGGKVDKVG